ncbi:hypothetical protein ANCCAN_05604 [Ancylostoma caninum]|uniref:Uncharacterized protein n=1 Tax=Ancylostoma caninum TaxID=29170 RepID=A0A368GZ72_ANCCA|nr:hypothetical protein ANCCAN_05604 [Ancylostoma caninum]
MIFLAIGIQKKRRRRVEWRLVRRRNVERRRLLVLSEGVGSKAVQPNGSVFSLLIKTFSVT